MATEIKLQALKENVDSVEVNAVKVAVGDVVAPGQTLLEVQADKAALDVPADMAGRITTILVKPGDQVKVGQVFCLMEPGNGAPAKKEPATEKVVARQTEATKEPAPAERQRVENRVAAATTNRTPAPPAPPVERPTPAPPPATEKVVPAGPATRRLARELGIDLALVRGSARNGRVVEEDVKSYVRQLAAGTAPVAALPVAGGGLQAPPLPRFEDWGPVDRQALTPVRRATARQMTLAWSLVPHVTQHDLADITELEAFRKQSSEKGPKMTVTAFALKAAAILLKQYPQFNASLDMNASQLILKRYYHLGVAVDTKSGLLVPVIRDVDQKSIEELAKELTEVAEKAREGKAEMKGGTFTITNLGGIGGTAFTPIVNYPEVAILGLSRSRLEPVVRGGQIVPRLMLPLSLSYDHRVIDGADAARFTRRLAELLENPLQMLLYA